MRIQYIGLAGKARVGKDTIADHLVSAHGFRKVAFSDELYKQVSVAFNVPQDFLRAVETKEEPTGAMSLINCTDPAFNGVARQKIEADLKEGVLSCGTGGSFDYLPLSPRWILQVWGTEYRRAQDWDYWIKEADLELQRLCEQAGGQTVKVVNTTVRFQNEADYIRQVVKGRIWHVWRGDIRSVNPHVSERQLEKEPGDQEIYNNSTIERLQFGTTYLLGHPALSLVRLENADYPEPGQYPTDYPEPEAFAHG